MPLSTTPPKSKSPAERVAFVISNPIRIDALAILNERVASPSEIARQIGLPLNKVANHIKILAEADCIELVESVPKHNTVEHFYRASRRPFLSDEDWAKLSEPERRELSSLVFLAVVGEGLGALRAGTFDSRDDRHLSWIAMIFDEQAWQELKVEMNESLERIMEIGARATERLAESGETGFSVVAAAMSFERATPGRSRRPSLPL
jgi:hypothetical protein